MGARDYDPRLGRWLSADTIVPSFANPQSLNRYAYVQNNPLRYTDPTGHCEWIGLGGGIGDLPDSTADEDTRERIIKEIESLGPFVFVYSDPWTIEELLLLKEAIINHPFREGFSSAKKITIRRKDHYEPEDPFNPVGGFTKDLGVDDEDLEGEYEVTIYDVAWQLEPAMNSTFLLERSGNNFAGVIAHELTHVALQEQPVLVDMWGGYQAIGRNSREGSVVGHGRSRQGMTNEEWAKEMIAFTVAAYMYQPDALVYRPPGISCQGPRDHWSLAWVKDMESMLNSK